MKKTITLHIEKLSEGAYLATSPDVQGLVVEEDSVEKVIATARELAETLLELHAEMDARRRRKSWSRQASANVTVRTPLDISLQVAM